VLRKCAVDFVEICNVYIGKMIIKAAKRILNSDKICCSYSDLNFGVTFFGTQCSSDTSLDSDVISSIPLQATAARGFGWCGGATRILLDPIPDADNSKIILMGTSEDRAVVKFSRRSGQCQFVFRLLSKISCIVKKLKNS